MFKKNNLLLTALAIMLVFSMAVISCGGGETTTNPQGGTTPGGTTPTGNAARLIGKWYNDQSAKDVGVFVYEFKSDGWIYMYNVGQLMQYTATSNTITTSIYGLTMGTANYSISGNTLTITNVGDSGLTAGTYIK